MVLPSNCAPAVKKMQSPRVGAVAGAASRWPPCGQAALGAVEGLDSLSPSSKPLTAAPMACLPLASRVSAALDRPVEQLEIVSIRFGGARRQRDLAPHPQHHTAHRAQGHRFPPTGSAVTVRPWGARWRGCLDAVDRTAATRARPNTSWRSPTSLPPSGR